MMLKLPICKYCRNQWIPQKGVVASNSYCQNCRNERQTSAIQFFDAKPIEPEEGLGAYVLSSVKKN